MTEHDVAARNRAAFVAMLTALGAKDFETFERYLDADILCEWPYPPMEGFPAEMKGARTVRQCFERDMGAFTPYNYTIQKIYSTDDPAVVIAEYSSSSTYLPRNVPYGNKYVGIMIFSDGKITVWREYVNPVPIQNVVGGDQMWSKDAGRKTKSS